MKNEKVKNIVIGVLVAIIVILVVVIGFVYNDRKNYKETNNNTNNQSQENVNENENGQNDNKTEQDDNSVVDNDDKTEQKDNNVEDNDDKYGESDFIRQTKVTLIEEPNCNGFDSSNSLVANIETDGNISVSQGGGAILVTPGNAKYLYSVGKLVCDAVDLYYITEDNSLYMVDTKQLTSGLDHVATKVTDSEVVEFLGTEEKEVEDGYNRYLKVLLKNGEVEYINYLTTVK